MVRSPPSPGGGSRAAELLRIVSFEKPDQQRVGVLAFERDEFASVVDRFGDSVDGDLASLFFEAEGVFLLDCSERPPVGLGDPHRVVVQLAGDTGLGGGDPDDAVNPIGVEERFLGLGEWFGHEVVPAAGCGAGVLHRSIAAPFPCLWA